jgi:hypothetical protein
VNKLNWHLDVCCATNGACIEITEYINFVMFIVGSCVNSPVHSMVEDL